MQLPDLDKSFEYENNFYLSCDPSRIGKMLAHYELYKKIVDIPGSAVECGVFKGASLSRFAIYRHLVESAESRKIIGFDIFGEFPETKFDGDVIKRENFINSAGSESISVEQLEGVLLYKGLGKNIELVKGDIVKTVPAYVNTHPELNISFLNLDTDIYEPAVTILEHLYPLIVKGGILLLDDYGVFPGETKAVDDYFRDKDVVIRKMALSNTPCYIIKE